MQENKKALVLLNMGGARNKDELKMFLTNMFNDRNILSSSSIKYVFRWLASDLAKQLAINSSRETIKFRKKDLTMVKMIINDIKEWRDI